MATPNYARFFVNASGPDDKKFEATNGQSLTLTLETVGPVLSVTYAAYNAGDPTSPLATAGAAAFNFSNAQPSIIKSPASTAETFNAPSIGSAGAAWLVRATAVIPGGVHVFERKVYVRNGRIGLVIPGETTQGGPRGWADEVSLATGTPPDTVVSETFALAGTITPAQITGIQHNYAPTGHADATVWRLSSNAEQFITGIAGGFAGRILKLQNVGSFPIGLGTDHSSSSAANRFSDMPGVTDSFGESVYLMPNEEIEIIYDGTQTKWRFCHRARNVIGESTFSTGPMAADTHNLNRFQANLIRLSANAGPFNLTGLAAGTDRMQCVIFNAGSNAFNLAHENASSTATNRFSLPGGSALSIPAGGSVSLIYDGAAIGGLNRWIVATPTGGASFPVDVQVAETFALQGDLTPATITADQNDYAPAGIADATRLRLAANAHGRRITGLQGGADGRMLILDNIGSFEIAILPDSGLSTAANRILVPLGGNGEWRLKPQESLILIYDSTSSRWRSVGSLSGILGRWTFSGTLTADTNNYGRFGANYLRVDPDTSGPWKITGVQEAGTDREELVIANIDTATAFRISHEDAGSTAANRFLLPQPEIIVRGGESASFVYDLTAARWRLAHTGTGDYPGELVQVSINADQNDYNVSGFIKTMSIARVTPDANGRRITGLAATGFGLGKELTFFNNSAFSFILQNESSSSSASNRFALPFDQLFVPPGGSIRVFYDTLGSRWRPILTDAGPVFTRGANLTDANQTLQVSGGVDYQLPFGTLTASRDKTLGNTSPGTGTVITIRRFDKQAFTLVIKNHDGSTLFTFASATPGEADFRFDGANWVHAGYKPYPT